MLKVMIADDELIIRCGLRNALDWEQLGCAIVAEAEDGEIALEKAQEYEPDLLLLDICMPFLNGLALIEELNKLKNTPVIIIISGHNEFRFAKKAVSLQVFDYLVKPINKEELLHAVEGAIERIEQSRQIDGYISWTREQLAENHDMLRQKFLSSVLTESISAQEMKKQCEYYGLSLTPKSGMMLVRISDRSLVNVDDEWDFNLLRYAVHNIVEELMRLFSNSAVFYDKKDNVVAISNTDPILEWESMAVKISQTIDLALEKQVFVTAQLLFTDGRSILDTYQELLTEVQSINQKAPIIHVIKNYIDHHYADCELSLSHVSNEVMMNPTYLSKMMKNELGMSFIDYLTTVRIRQAIVLMNNSPLKMYEIAEAVGYKSQHYFSAAFKKIMGVSPLNYQKKR